MPDLLEGTVDVPGAGKIKKRYVMIPAGLAAVYVAYRWYQASRSEGEPAPGADGLYSSDDLSEYGLSTTGGATTVTGNAGSIVTDGTNPNAIDDNAEWSDRVVEKLTNQGYDGQVVYAALGEFLARRSLDKTEASIARAALAAAGQPPVGGPYSVIEAATTAPAALKAPTGLKATAVGTTTVTLAWDRVDGAGYYRVYRSGVATNVGATDGGNTTITVGGLEPNKEYSFAVAADTTTNKPGPRSSAIRVKTKAVTLTRPTGLKSSAVTRSSFRVSVTPVKGATGYRWFLNGTQVAPTDAPYRDFVSLRPNTSYRVAVAADNSTQAPGPTSGTLTVKTKK
jgi:hypothetical protein